MALIPCYECYKEISEKTPACPHCGAPKDESPFKFSRYGDEFEGTVPLERWGVSRKLEGPYQMFFYERGQDVRLAINAFYKDGVEDGLFEWFGPSGRIRERVHYVNGKKEGAYIESKVPVIVETGYYVDGMKHGDFEARYDTKWSDDHDHRVHCELREEGTYKNGKRDGPHKRYYLNGRLEFEVTYKDGEWHGPTRWYLENGELDEEGCYDMGEKCGEWKHYHRTLIFKTRKVETVSHPPCPRFT